jgi:hypothetical protein
MANLKERIENLLREKVANRVRFEGKSLIKKDMNAYTKLDSTGISNSTGIATEGKKDKK